MSLEVEHLSVAYGDSVVIEDLSLKVDDGALYGIVGRNGMGKTTFIEAIMGVHRLAGGRIRFHGDDVTELDAAGAYRRGFGWIPQGRRVFPSLRVAEHLELSYANRNGNAWSPQTVYERIPILGERRKQFAGSLSGGQQSMLALGRALVANPTLLLVDEPTEGLDSRHRNLMRDILAELHQAGITIVLVEQQIEIVQQLCTEVSVMERGAVIQHFGIGAEPSAQSLMEAVGFHSQDA